MELRSRHIWILLAESFSYVISDIMFEGAIARERERESDVAEGVPRKREC